MRVNYHKMENDCYECIKKIYVMYVNVTLLNQRCVNCTYEVQHLNFTLIQVYCLFVAMRDRMLKGLWDYYRECYESGHG